MESLLADRAQRLVNAFRTYRPLLSHSESSPQFVIALSGGVDSAVVSKAAMLSGCTVVAVTAHSPSVAQLEREDASVVARVVGINHRELATEELSSSDYSRNDARRCFHCKTHLFTRVKQEYPDSVIVTGTNADDLGDYRPGLQAAEDHRVFSPLADLGYRKQEVRELALHWGLPIHDKPASPCLASRLAYGVEVTAERLARIENAERWLREFGLVEFRVRLHEGELARIEVHPDEIVRIANSEVRQRLNREFKRLGFRYVTLDLVGFQSGSLNRLVTDRPVFQIQT